VQNKGDPSEAKPDDKSKDAPAADQPAAQPDKTPVELDGKAADPAPAEIPVGAETAARKKG